MTASARARSGGKRAVTLGIGWSMALPVVAALSSCSQGRTESASLANAVLRYRTADNDAKPGASEAIARVACTEAEVCEAKRACLAASEPTVAAIKLKKEVERGLGDVRHHKLAPTDVAAAGLSEKLDEAQRLLGVGHAALDGCDEKLTALKLKYRL